MKSINKMIIIASCGMLLSLSAQAGISHCYHWMNTEGNSRLEAKFDYAAKNNGALLLKDDSAAPQDGMYCTDQIWRGAVYGDRVIRIDFAEDLVMSNDHGNLCGKDENYFRAEECQKKEPDVKFLNKELGWYYILPNRPTVIRSWSANGEALAQELQKALSEHAEVASNIQAALTAMSAEKSGKNIGHFTNVHGRQGLDEQIKDESKWASLGLMKVLERVAVSKGLSEAEKAKIADKVFAKLLAGPQFKINSKETAALVNTSALAKTAFARQLLKNEARWKEMGVSQVLDQIYFSNLPEAARTEAVNKILEQMYPGLRGVAQLAAMKAGMANSTALQALYSHRYFSSEQNWTDHKNPIDILKQAASDGNLSKAEQETVYLKTFAKMFGNQTPVYDRAQLAELMRNPAMVVAFRTSFVAQSQKTLDGANIQLILDGFILTGTRMNEVQAKALSSYLSTHAGLKTSHLVATFKELGYTIL